MIRKILNVVSGQTEGWNIVFGDRFESLQNANTELISKAMSNPTELIDSDMGILLAQQQDSGLLLKQALAMTRFSLLESCDILMITVLGERAPALVKTRIKRLSASSADALVMLTTVGVIVMTTIPETHCLCRDLALKTLAKLSPSDKDNILTFEDTLVAKPADKCFLTIADAILQCLDCNDDIPTLAGLERLISASLVSFRQNIVDEIITRDEKGLSDYLQI